MFKIPSKPWQKYRVELKLGKRTETLDAEGKIIEEKEIPQNMLEQSNKSNIEKTLKHLKEK